MPLRSFRSRWLVSTIVLLLALAGVGATMLYRWSAYPDVDYGAIRVSHKTTHLTEPLRPDGTVDYLEAINRRSGANRSPSDNVVVLIWQALGPDRYNPEMRSAYFRELGIKLPAEGDYFISWETFAREQAESMPVDAAAIGEILDQIETVVTRPWSEKDFSIVASWLRANAKPLDTVRRAAERTAYWDPLVSAPGHSYQLLELQLVTTIECRALAIALIAQALLSASHGEVDDAWSDMMRVHRLSRFVMQGPMLIQRLIGLAINAQACAAERTLVQHATLSADQIARFRSDLSSLGPIPDMVELLDTSERYVCLDAIISTAHDVRNGGKLDVVPNSLLDPLRNLIDRREVDWNAVLERVNVSWDQNIAACRLATPTLRNAKLRELDDEFIQQASEQQSRQRQLTAPFESRSSVAAAGRPVFCPDVGGVIRGLRCSRQRSCRNGPHPADAGTGGVPAGSRDISTATQRTGAWLCGIDSAG